MANRYAREGYTTVLQDTYLGPHLHVLVRAITYRPLHLVVRAPAAATVKDRDAERRATRGKVAYHPGRMEVEQLDIIFASRPHGSATGSTPAT